MDLYLALAGIVIAFLAGAAIGYWRGRVYQCGVEPTDTELALCSPVQPRKGW